MLFIAASHIFTIILLCFTCLLVFIHEIFGLFNSTLHRLYFTRCMLCTGNTLEFSFVLLFEYFSLIIVYYNNLVWISVFFVILRWVHFYCGGAWSIIPTPHVHAVFKSRGSVCFRLLSHTLLSAWPCCSMEPCLSCGTTTPLGAAVYCSQHLDWLDSLCDLCWEHFCPLKRKEWRETWFASFHTWHFAIRLCLLWK